MAKTLSRATQIVYRMWPRLASDEEILVIDASGEVSLTTKEAKHSLKLPESCFAELLERFEQYKFKSVTGVHGDAMSDYTHILEVHEGPKKKARCTLRFNHEFGTLIGDAPVGIKETITLLSRLCEKLTQGVEPDEALDTSLIELGRGIDFPYINPHGGPGTFVLLDRKGKALPASPMGWSMPYADGLLPCRVGDKYGFIRISGELMIPAPVATTVDTGLEDLQDLFESKNYLAFPVVDDAGQLKGIVSRAAVNEALSEVQTEDYLKSSGIVGGEEQIPSVYNLRSVEGDVVTLDVQIGQTAPAGSAIEDTEGGWENTVSEAMGGGEGVVVLSLKRIAPVRTDVTVGNRVVIDSTPVGGGSASQTAMDSSVRVVTEGVE